jgi:hypothetical protein
VSPELQVELALLPRRNRIGLLAAALVADPTLPRLRAISWLTGCIVELAGNVGAVERIAVAAQLRTEADLLPSERTRQVDRAEHGSSRCRPAWLLDPRGRVLLYGSQQITDFRGN